MTRWICTLIVLFVFYAVPPVYAQAKTGFVIGVDLSRPAKGEHGELSNYMLAVRAAIDTIATPDTRLAVFAINESGFGDPLLDDVTPADPGDYPEHLEALLEDWKKAAGDRWQTIAAKLKADAKGSDIFGMLSRAALVLEAADTKRLLMLSDMREYEKGRFNFESPLLFKGQRLSPRAMLDEVKKLGLVAQLQGVVVQALGVTTTGLSPSEWKDLGEFWQLYFKESGSRLITYSPDYQLKAW